MIADCLIAHVYNTNVPQQPLVISGIATHVPLGHDSHIHIHSSTRVVSVNVSPFAVAHLTASAYWDGVIAGGLLHEMGKTWFVYTRQWYQTI